LPQHAQLFFSGHFSMQQRSAEIPAECIMETGILFAPACLIASLLAL
jgi:hypothetical protein